MFAKKYLFLLLTSIFTVVASAHAAGVMCNAALTTPSIEQNQPVQRLEQLLNAPYAEANEGLFSGPLGIAVDSAEAQNMFRVALQTWQHATDPADLAAALQNSTQFQSVLKTAQTMRQLFRALGETHQAPDKLEQLLKKLDQYNDATPSAVAAKELAAALSSNGLAKLIYSFKPASQASTSAHMKEVMQSLQSSLTIRRPMSAYKIQQLGIQMGEILTPLRLQQALTPDPSLAMLIRRLTKLQDMMGQLTGSSVPSSVRDAVTSEGPELFVPQTLAEDICETLSLFSF